jgi:hypothetical protein
MYTTPVPSDHSCLLAGRMGGMVSGHTGIPCSDNEVPTCDAQAGGSWAVHFTENHSKLDRIGSVVSSRKSKVSHRHDPPPLPHDNRLTNAASCILDHKTVVRR